jgi:hypothetical protein
MSLAANFTIDGGSPQPTHRRNLSVDRGIHFDGQPLLFLLRRWGLRPFFLKFCSYFPHNAKLCINGHEYLKRQLAKRGVAFEALDNGIKSCADRKLMQRVCDELSAGKRSLAAPMAQTSAASVSRNGATVRLSDAGFRSLCKRNQT